MEQHYSMEWLKRFAERVNADAEMEVIGEWLTTGFALVFGDRKFVVQMEKGKVLNIIENPRIDDRSLFGFRAPVAIWDKFLSPRPPALYNDFFAMLMRVPEFHLDGDALAVMQNARALQRTMNLLRQGKN
jgi:hypothetical protein